MRGDEGRARIEVGTASLRAKFRNAPREALQLLGGVLRCGEPADAGGCFLGGIRQIVQAAARVRLHVGEALVLSLQRRQQSQQSDMLVHVGEITGVKTVSVLHRYAAA